MIKEREDGALPLANEKELLRLYYDGRRLPSPAGGFLILLRVQPEDDGSGALLLECNSSSLRFYLTVSKATRTERSKVKGMLDEGREPQCPRHATQFLIRGRRGLECQLCGVRYSSA